MGNSGGVIAYEGAGGVAGPVTSTDKAVALFSGTDGQTLQNSSVIVSAGAVTGVTQLAVDNLRLDGNTLSSEDSNGPVIVDPNGTGPLRLASGIFQIGGSSASFPALRANGSDLEIRLADDSNYSLLTARYFAAIAGDGSYRFKAQADVGAIFAAAGQILWSSASTLGGVSTGDTGEKRDSAGVILDTNGSSGLGARLTGRVVEASTAGSGAPNLLAVTESRKLLTNEGATAENYHTLPTSASIGYEQSFYCQDMDGIRVIAPTGCTIRLGPAAVSATGGFVRSSTIGSGLTLIKINATEFVSIAMPLGTWMIDI